MGKELIIEERFECAQVLETGMLPDGRRKLTFLAVVAEGDYVNNNSRLYPTHILQEAFTKTNEDLAAYPGAVGHPDRPEFGDNGIMWEPFTFEGTKVYGRGTIIWTAKGSDLAANLEAGVRVGFSTRTYASWKEQDIDGRTVRVITQMDAPFVDAVQTPSVPHARVMSVSREEQERMNEELQTAQEALAAAEARVAELTATAAAQVTATEALATENAALKQRVTDLEATLAANASVAVEAKLISLTSGHRFAPTIISQAKALGATIETAETVVKSLTALVEAAASAHTATPPPAGDLATEEDAEDALPEGAIKVGDRVFSAEALAELKASGLY